MEENITKAMPQRKLISLSNNFGRLIEYRGCKLIGVDGKEVESIDRSKPEKLWVGKYAYGCDLSKKRKNGLESPYKFRVEGEICYLTATERDLILGSNYHMVDDSYSAPSEEKLQKLFSANNYMSSKYNAFEFGDLLSSHDSIELPILYHKISDERFRELRDYQINRKDLIDKLRQERK